MTQYVLLFWRYGFIGWLYSLWHVVVLLGFALYVDHRRGKNLEKWRYENKPVTTKQIDEYVSMIKKKSEEEKKEQS